MVGRMATETKAAGAKKPGAGTTKATARKKRSQPRTKKAEDTESSEPGLDMKKSLCEEAHTTMGSESSSIIEHLLARAKRGDMKSAAMLVELAKNETRAKEALKHLPLRSQALLWAAEPPWQDEVDRDKAETGSGSRETK